MKCPHCGHKIGCFRFMLTVINPWRMRCSKCSKNYSIGKKGNLVLLLGAVVAAGIGLAIYDKSLMVIAGAGCVYGALIEYLIWAIDEPVKKES